MTSVGSKDGIQVGTMGGASGVIIRGGAGPFEAAVVAAVLDQVVNEEEALARRRPPSSLPPAWVRVGAPVPFGRFVETVIPDRTGPDLD